MTPKTDFWLYARKNRTPLGIILRFLNSQPSNNSTIVDHLGFPLYNGYKNLQEMM